MRAVNLIPENQRERSTGFANRSNGVVYVVLGVIAVLALMVGLYGKARHEVSSKEAEVTHYEAEAQRVQAQATSLAPYKTFIAMREGREDAVRELVDTRFDWSHALAEFGRVLPPGTSVTALEGCVAPPTKSGSSGEGCGGSSGGSGSKSSSAVTSATPAGSIPKFTIAGCATSQSVVSRMLSDLRLMDGVASAELQSASKSGAGGGSGGGTCQGNLVSFGAKVEFQPIPSPPSSGSSGSSSSSSKTVPASSTSGSGSSGSGSSGAPE